MNTHRWIYALLTLGTAACGSVATPSHARQSTALHEGGTPGALRNAEVEVCAGISEKDRNLSPFANRKDVRSVRDLIENQAVGREYVERVTGIEVIVRATPGLTAEWLQRVMDCHLARNAAIGYETASHEMHDCPLALGGIAARVRSTGDGFAVGIRSEDRKVVKELRRRGVALLEKQAAARP